MPWYVKIKDKSREISIVTKKQTEWTNRPIKISNRDKYGIECRYMQHDVLMECQINIKHSGNAYS